MKSLFVVVTLVCLAVFAPQAQSHQHGEGAGHNHSSMEARGNEAMGFDQLKTAHNFLLTRNGGVVRVLAKDPADQASIHEVRTHMKEIAAAFKAGDFEKPGFIHAKMPPGVETMKRLKNEISYKFQLLELGAQIVISTRNAQARKAIADFFRMQIEDHGTGDPLP